MGIEKRSNTMRKVFVSNLVTVDGFFAGPNGEIDWHNVDAEFNDYAISMLNSIDTMLFGRVTYDMMAGYWPTAAVLKDDPIVAGKMNSLAKIVFSKTLDKVEWENTRLVKENIAEEIQKLKQQPGKDIAILGSGTIVQLLTNLRLIDEYWLLVNPIILGKGKPLFKDIKEKVNLKLLDVRKFDSGNVMLKYHPM